MILKTFDPKKADAIFQEEGKTNDHRVINKNMQITSESLSCSDQAKVTSVEFCQRLVFGS